jgi:predicted MFS family arabinose efflux permease
MRVRFQLFIVMLLRAVLNTMHRMVYPFLSIFARGLGVDVTTLSLAMTARNFVGVFAPIVAPIADQRGRKFGMLTGILIFTCGVGLVAVFPNIITLSVALILAILGKYIFDPAMQAYFGDRIPYSQRGTALAVTEMAWSLAFIIGVPVMAFLIARNGWSAPFPILAISGLIMFAVIFWMIPKNDPHHEASHNSRENFRMIFTSVPALAGMSISLWASAANEMVNLVFGVWLENSFGLKIAALAAASAVIGFSELSGEGLVALTTDRLGKPRALMLGLIGNALACVLLPVIGRSEAGALVGLFLFYITFEYVMVSHIPMMTELAPEARATLLTFNLTGHSIGRAIGGFLATFIFQAFGFPFVAGMALLLNIFALLALAELQKKIEILPRILSWAKSAFSRSE